MTFASVPFEELVQALGAAAVVTDRAALDQRSHDSWPVASKWARQDKHPYSADVVVWPASPKEVADVLRIATRAGVPVTPWGLGSSVTGQPLPVEGGIVLDLSQMTGPLELNEVVAGAPGRGDRELQTLGMAEPPRQVAGKWLPSGVVTRQSSRARFRPARHRPCCVPTQSWNVGGPHDDRWPFAVARRVLRLRRDTRGRRGPHPPERRCDPQGARADHLRLPDRREWAG